MTNSVSCIVRYGYGFLLSDIEVKPGSYEQASQKVKSQLNITIPRQTEDTHNHSHQQTQTMPKVHYIGESSGAAMLSICNLSFDLDR